MIGWTSRSTPIAFSVPGWTNGLLVSICACLAHMYMEKHKVGHISPCSSVFFFVVLNSANHLHTINCDIWLLSITNTSFLHWLISVLLLLKIFTLEQTFLLLQASS